MSQVRDARLPLPARAGRVSNDASISLISFNGLDGASACGNDPPELLGVSAGLPPMSISSTLPRTPSKSPGSRQPLYTNDPTSDYNCPQDLDLSDQHGAQHDWERYQVNDNNHEQAADPLQRLASAEPEQLPWSALHLNGVPTSQSDTEQMEKSSLSTRNVRVGQQRSTAGSRANETDDSGYHTYSQIDTHSMYSGDSHQMHQVRAGQSSIPRTMPSMQGQSRFINYDDNESYTPMDYEVRGSMEAPRQQEPLRCEERGCSFTCKTRSDLKKHTARHKREHVCDEPGCQRGGKGFATINDLERHQKAVHKMKPSHGHSRTFKCFGANCKQEEKEWPRFDNFKQHLVRMHKTEDTDALIKRSNDWYENEKKPPQPTSISTPQLQPSALRLRLPNANESYGATSHQQQSQSHLSPTWTPSANSTRPQQLKTPSRTRHASFSGHPDPSRAFGFGVTPLRHFQSLDVSPAGGSRLDQFPGISNLKQLSPAVAFNYTHQPLRERATPAYTVPNPDTPALSDLPGMSSPYSANFPIPQVDFAQIASKFSSDQQLSLPTSDQDINSPSMSPNGTQQTPLSSPISLNGIRALMGLGGNGGGNQDARAAAMIERIMQAGIEKLSESQHRSAATTTTSPAPSSITTTNLTSNPDVPDARVIFRCTEHPCKKTYPRACDLKKHLKRHHRPYGCTFPKCFEKFGSKYDWKRHETSQHFQLECWKCALCPSNESRNGQSGSPHSFYKRTGYETHLKNVHSLSPDPIREHVSKQRIGRDCRSRFWCGFCKCVVELQKKGLEGVDERFNHIDNHFKAELQIEEWVDLDRHVAKGSLENEAEGEVELDDVLGSDGITGGSAGTRYNDHDKGEGNLYDANAGQAIIGQKRAHPSDSDIPSSSSDTRQAKRHQSRPRAQFFQCHECRKGPWLLQHSTSCLECQHECCELCNLLDGKGRIQSNSS